MKHIQIILGLILFASVTTFAQSPRIKLNQITKDNAVGSILISSPTDSGMVYSRDFFINFGTDTTLVLFGDTIGGGISTVVTDLFTIQGDGSVATPLYVDTSVINTIQGMIDTLTARGYLTTEVDGSTTNEIQTLSKVGQTVSLSLSGGSFTDDVLTESEVDAFVANNGYLTAEVDGSVTNELQTISKTGQTVTLSNGGGSFTDDVLTETDVDNYVANNGYLTSEVDGSVSNEGSLTVVAGGSNDSEIQSNTSGSTNVTIAGGSNVTVTESGNTITIASTASGGGGSIPVDTFVTIAGTETITGAKTFTNTFTQSGGDANFNSNTLYVKSSTNRVGIGIDIPGTPLHIKSSDGNLLSLDHTSLTGSPFLSFNQNGIRRSFIQHADVDDQLILASEYGDINFKTSTAGSETSRMIIKDDGNVAIDDSTLYVDADSNTVSIGGIIESPETSPAKLTILNTGGLAKMNLVNTDTSTNWASFLAGVAGSAFWFKSTSRYVFSSKEKYGEPYSSDWDNSFVIYGKDYATTAYAGNFGVGLIDPVQKLDVNGNARFRSIGNATRQGALSYTSDGTLTTNTSDLRLKTNLQPYENVLDKVMLMNPYTFNWINDSEITDLGFVAQEVEELFPLLVFTTPTDDYKGLHYDRIPVITIKAIQEQQAIIETQEQKITDLESTIQALITRIENLENK